MRKKGFSLLYIVITLFLLLVASLLIMKYGLYQSQKDFEKVVLWTHKASSIIDSHGDGDFNENALYVTGYNLQKIDSANGQVLWEYEGVNLEGNYKILKKYIFVSIQHGDISLFDKDTGLKLWTRNYGKSPKLLSEDENSIFLEASGHYLVIDPKTGIKQSDRSNFSSVNSNVQSPIEGFETDNAIIKRTHVCAISDCWSEVEVFDKRQNKQVFKGRLFDDILIKNNIVYFTTNQGILYAVK